MHRYRYAYLVQTAAQNSNRLRLRVRMQNDAYSAAVGTYFSAGDLIVVYQSTNYQNRSDVGIYQYVLTQNCTHA